MSFPEAVGAAIENGLIFAEIIHGFVALPFAFIIWRKWRSWKLILLYFTVLFLMDADHLLDFWLHAGFNFNVYEMLSLRFFVESGRAIVFLHAWEWVILLGLIAWIKRFPPALTTIVLAVLAHLIVDMFTVGSVIFYSITHRALQGFSVSA